MRTSVEDFYSEPGLGPDLGVVVVVVVNLDGDGNSNGDMAMEPSPEQDRTWTVDDVVARSSLAR